VSDPPGVYVDVWRRMVAEIELDDVLTKEVIILRPGRRANFDSFYLLWAMTLKIVRDQWRRVVFMQTNREDVGRRWREIEVPVPASREIAECVSEPFRTYYEAIAGAREALAAYLQKSDDHHFFVSGAELPEPETRAAGAGRDPAR
jgi:type I restriction enzyme M protein